MTENEGWVNEQSVEIPYDELPQPMYWRMLVMPVRPQEKSKGGIVIASAAQDAQEHLNYIGKVVAVGGCCGKHKKFEGEEKVVGVGDWVLYSRYAGQKVEYKGLKMLFINDDEVLGLVKNPEGFRVYV